MFNKVLIFMLTIGSIYFPLLVGNEVYEAQSVYGGYISENIFKVKPLHFRLKEHVFKQTAKSHVLPGDKFYIVNEYKESLPNNSYRVHLDVISLSDNNPYTFTSEIITRERYHKIVDVKINEYTRTTADHNQDYTDKQYVLTLEDRTQMVFAACIFRNSDLYMQYPNITVGDYVSLSNFGYAENELGPNYESWIWYRTWYSNSSRAEGTYKNLYERKGVYTNIQFYHKNNEQLRCYFNQPGNGDFFILSQGPRSSEEHLITAQGLDERVHSSKMIWDVKSGFSIYEKAKHNIYIAESVYGSYAFQQGNMPMHFRLKEYVFKQTATSFVIPGDKFYFIGEHKEYLPNNSYRIHLLAISLLNDIPYTFVSEIITQESYHKIVDIEIIKTSNDNQDHTNKQYLLTLEDGTAVLFCNFPSSYYLPRPFPDIIVGDYVSLSNFGYPEEHVWYKKSSGQTEDIYNNLYERRGVYNSIQFYRKKNDKLSCYFDQSISGDFHIFSHGPRSIEEHKITTNGTITWIPAKKIYDMKPDLFNISF